MTFFFQFHLSFLDFVKIKSAKLLSFENHWKNIKNSFARISIEIYIFAFLCHYYMQNEYYL